MRASSSSARDQDPRLVLLAELERCERGRRAPGDEGWVVVADRLEVTAEIEHLREASGRVAAQDSQACSRYRGGRGGECWRTGTCRRRRGPGRPRRHRAFPAPSERRRGRPRHARQSEPKGPTRRRWPRPRARRLPPHRGRRATSSPARERPSRRHRRRASRACARRRSHLRRSAGPRRGLPSRGPLPEGRGRAEDVGPDQCSLGERATRERDGLGRRHCPRVRRGRRAARAGASRRRSGPRTWRRTRSRRSSATGWSAGVNRSLAINPASSRRSSSTSTPTKLLERLPRSTASDSSPRRRKIWRPRRSAIFARSHRILDQPVRFASDARLPRRRQRALRQSRARAGPERDLPSTGGSASARRRYATALSGAPREAARHAASRSVATTWESLSGEQRSRWAEIRSGSAPASASRHAALACALSRSNGASAS